MKQAFDDVPDRFRFVWPEPLIHDLADEHYRALTEPAERSAVIKLHAKILRDLFDGLHRDSLALRLELVNYCHSRGVGEDVIGRVDRSVFWELTRLIETTFRNSHRQRREVGTMLHAAFAVLSPEQAPVRVVAPSPVSMATPRFAGMVAA